MLAILFVRDNDVAQTMMVMAQQVRTVRMRMRMRMRILSMRPNL
jgi:hypothetical protein